MPKEHGSPVYGTQGGGLAQRSSDNVSAELGIPPVSEVARRAVSADEQREFNAGVDELFDVLFRKHDEGEVSIAQIDAFFPDAVKNRN